MPRRGVRELDRVGPAEVFERYGVSPAQVPDFIALRGDPSDRIPGARGIGAKRAAQILAEYGTLDAALEAGRFSDEADALRTYLPSRASSTTRRFRTFRTPRSSAPSPGNDEDASRRPRLPFWSDRCAPPAKAGHT